MHMAPKPPKDSLIKREPRKICIGVLCRSVRKDYDLIETELPYSSLVIQLCAISALP